MKTFLVVYGRSATRPFVMCRSTTDSTDEVRAFKMKESLQWEYVYLEKSEASRICCTIEAFTTDIRCSSFPSPHILKLDELLENFPQVVADRKAAQK